MDYSSTAAYANFKNFQKHQQNYASHTHKNRNLTPTENLKNIGSGYRRSIRILARTILEKIPSGSIGPYISLDCEMVGIGPNGLQSALAKVSVVNWEGAVILDTFVKVAVPVTDYRTFVSGVTAQDIESEDAMDLDVCRCIVQSLLYGRVLIGHALMNDLCILMIDHPWYNIRDTATYTPFMQLRKAHNSKHGHQMKARKLRDLAWDKLGICIQKMGKAHSSIEDSRAALELYKLARNEWETLVSWQVKKAFETTNVNTISFNAFQRRSPRVPSATPSPQTRHTHSKQVFSSSQRRKYQNKVVPVTMRQDFNRNSSSYFKQPAATAGVAHNVTFMHDNSLTYSANIPEFPYSYGEHTGGL